MAIKHGSNTRIVLGGYNLSCDMNEVTFTADRDVADVTAFCDEAKTYIPGQHSWKADVKGWLNSEGTVNSAGSIDGAARSDVSLWYLQNSGTAVVKTDKVFGYFPAGFGTAERGMAGIGAVLNTTRTANVGAGNGVGFTFAGTTPFTPVRVLWGGTVNSVAGTGLAVNIGTPPLGQSGAYAYFWLLGTVGGNGTAQVCGTIRASDTLGGVYTDIARFSGTAAGAYAIQATVTSGSVPSYMDFGYRTSAYGADISVGTAQGTIIAAIGLIPPLTP